MGTRPRACARARTSSRTGAPPRPLHRQRPLLLTGYALACECSRPGGRNSRGDCGGLGSATATRRRWGAAVGALLGPGRVLWGAPSAERDGASRRVGQVQVWTGAFGAPCHSPPHPPPPHPSLHCASWPSDTGSGVLLLGRGAARTLTVCPAGKSLPCPRVRLDLDALGRRDLGNRGARAAPHRGFRSRPRGGVAPWPPSCAAAS